jgi:hypothetical protein
MYVATETKRVYASGSSPTFSASSVRPCRRAARDRNVGRFAALEALPHDEQLALTIVDRVAHLHGVRLERTRPKERLGETAGRG